MRGFPNLRAFAALVRGPSSLFRGLKQPLEDFWRFFDPDPLVVRGPSSLFRGLKPGALASSALAACSASRPRTLLVIQRTETLSFTPILLCISIAFSLCPRTLLVIQRTETPFVFDIGFENPLPLVRGPSSLFRGLKLVMVCPPLTV